MEQITDADELTRWTELHWAPCLSAAGQPRLAVISMVPSNQVSAPPGALLPHHDWTLWSGPVCHFCVAANTMPGARLLPQHTDA